MSGPLEDKLSSCPYAGIAPQDHSKIFDAVDIRNYLNPGYSLTVACFRGRRILYWICTDTTNGASKIDFSSSSFGWAGSKIGLTSSPLGVCVDFYAGLVQATHLVSNFSSRPSVSPFFMNFHLPRPAFRCDLMGPFHSTTFDVSTPHHFISPQRYRSGATFTAFPFRIGLIVLPLFKKLPRRPVRPTAAAVPSPFVRWTATGTPVRTALRWSAGGSASAASLARSPAAIFRWFGSAPSSSAPFAPRSGPSSAFAAAAAAIP